MRWLLAKDKNSKAKIIVFKAAEINKVKLSSNLVAAFDDENIALNKQQQQNSGAEKIDSWQVVKAMMKHRKLVIRFIIVYTIW